MTCKLNLFIFMIFIGVMGLNYYVGNDVKESGNVAENHHPKSSLNGPKYGYTVLQAKGLTTSFKSQFETKKDLNNSKSDTLTNISLQK